MIPALCLGGVPAWVVPLFLLFVFALFVRVTTDKTTREITLPRFWPLGLMLTGVTLLQYLPLTHTVASILAPGLLKIVDSHTPAAMEASWSRISVLPGATGLEAARLLGLTVVFCLGAQFSWRLIAAMVLATGTAVSVVGLGHLVTGSEAIFGLYLPLDRIAGPGAGLLTSFVNPNHQSSLLLLGLFCGLSLTLDQHLRGRQSHDGARSQRLAERSWMALTCSALQLLVLLLSLSRGAMVVGATLMVPMMFLLIRARRQEQLRGLINARNLLVAVAVLSVSIAVARLGAWQELLSLDNRAYAGKYNSVIDALDLIALSPVLGTGRGSFVDLFPLVDRNRDFALQTFTHIESFPITALVEWGPIFGGLFLGGSLVAWGLAFRHCKASAPRIALLGLAAVALHNLADFNLEFLGVSAPFVALAGSLSVPRRRPWSVKKFSVLAGPALLCAAMLSVSTQSGTWSALRTQHEAVAADLDQGVRALRQRPLDARVHAEMSRHAANAGQWPRAQTRAQSATALLPNAPEAWLLLAAATLEGASQSGGDLTEDHAALRAALRRLRRSPNAELVRYLSAHYDPKTLALLVDPDHESWSRIVAGFSTYAPVYTESLMTEVQRHTPEDPVALEFRSLRALSMDNPDLALHHARLLCRVAPRNAKAWVLQATALRHSLQNVDEQEIQSILERGANQPLDRPGLVEENLILSYLAEGTRSALIKAQTLLPRLLQRPALAPVTKRRRALGPTIADALRQESKSSGHRP